MTVDLTPDDIETLLILLKYSKQRIQDAAGTPKAVREENLDRLTAVADKLRRAKGHEHP
jgi:hypothetical protein